MNQKPIHVALAILYQDQKFLCQLRDNIPGIFYPGHWGFFGGHIELNELPQEAVKRELEEEIGYVPSQIQEFRIYREAEVVRHTFSAPLTVKINQLVLNEGWDMGLLSIAEIEEGKAFSAKAGGIWPLGPVHRQILLDFIKDNPLFF